jgi:MFS superfamily sulfate permease-like transporter
LVASLRGYNRSRLRTDGVAGITVAALALPASMAYANIAGLPVTAGLYSLLLPLVVYALLGSAPWLVVGPESTIALLVAAGLAPLAVAGTDEYTTLAAALALIVGGFYLAARLLRLGWIADYFSQAVLVGYITGVAILYGDDGINYDFGELLPASISGHVHEDPDGDCSDGNEEGEKHEPIERVSNEERVVWGQKKPIECQKCG